MNRFDTLPDTLHIIQYIETQIEKIVLHLFKTIQ